MAGIGFELKKLFVGSGVIRKMRAYAYAAVICSGTMILAVLLLLGIQAEARFFGVSEHIDAYLEQRKLVRGNRVKARVAGRSAYCVLDDLLRDAVLCRKYRPDTAAKLTLFMNGNKGTGSSFLHLIRQFII